MLRLNDDISKIKGVGAKKREKLIENGILTVFDLINYFPVKYRDKRNTVSANRLSEGRDQLIVGTLIRKSIRPFRRSSSMLECQFRDDTGYFSAVFFNMPFLSKNMVVGQEYVVFGKMKRRNGLPVFNSPEIYTPGSARDVRSIIPVYRQFNGISTNDLGKWVQYALENIEFEEWLDESVVDRRKLCDEKLKFNNLHFPYDESHYKYARFRQNYDTLYSYLLAIRINRQEYQENNQDASIEDVDISTFTNQLPFKLTDGQQNAINDIGADLSLTKPMNRLLQGDVGSGKTVVAETAIYRVVKTGKQCAFMAPTEILALQHYKSLQRDLEPFGINVAALTSSTKAAERRQILRELRDGEIDVIVGTHSLIQDTVEFNCLALVITDEQHRFGVNQRKVLSEKSAGVNVLVMSATPIPRTLATTVFGDMDFSIIKSKPASRKEIITRCVSGSGRAKAYSVVLNEIKQGNKAYIVAPSIEDDEESDLASAEKLFKEMKSKFKGFNVDLIHGRMSKDEKEAAMLNFAEGDTNILVSTVVIEVGIDVPGATIIVIENSDRFGLAQLHQLRGRVGRNDKQSYCYLINYSSSENATARMDAMVKFSDGFDISEEDFRLRGPGNIMGTMQHGQASSSIIEIMANGLLLDAVKEDVDNVSEDMNNDFVVNSLSNIYARDYSSVI